MPAFRKALQGFVCHQEAARACKHCHQQVLQRSGFSCAIRLLEILCGMYRIPSNKTEWYANGLGCHSAIAQFCAYFCWMKRYLIEQILEPFLMHMYIVLALCMPDTHMAHTHASLSPVWKSIATVFYLCDSYMYNCHNHTWLHDAAKHNYSMCSENPPLRVMTL